MIMSFDILHLFLTVNQPYKITFTSRPPNKCVLVFDYRDDLYPQAGTTTRAQTKEFVGEDFADCLEQLIKSLEF